MSGAMKPLTSAVKKQAAKNYGGKIGLDKLVGHNDSEWLGKAPTPLHKSDRVSAVQDPLGLTGEGEERAAQDAAEEAARLNAEARANIRPLPDEDEIERVKKREASRRRSTGRASTILSDDSYASGTLG